MNHAPIAFAVGDYSCCCKSILIFWMFCTEKQMSIGESIQFCNLTKIVIEILLSFVYNVFIVGRTSAPNQWEEISFPKGE